MKDDWSSTGHTRVRVCGAHTQAGAGEGRKVPRAWVSRGHTCSDGRRRHRMSKAISADGDSVDVVRFLVSVLAWTRPLAAPVRRGLRSAGREQRRQGY
jgi:hypothetical protein